MKFIIAIFLLVSFIFPRSVSADNISGLSGILLNSYKVNNFSEDPRILKMETFLVNYNSPLVKHSRLLVEASDNYDLPWTLVVSIAGVESGFCKKIKKESYNCWGWKNGNHNFESIEDAIFTVTRTLRNKYYNRGINTPELIAPIYAPPSLLWSRKVRYFMNLIENTQISDYSLQFTL